MAKQKKDATVPVVQSGRIWVTRQYKGAPEIKEEADLEVRTFEVEPAYVRGGYGLTINLGNYESARCDVSVSLPCYREEVKEALQVAFKLSEDAIQEQVSKIHARK